MVYKKIWEKVLNPNEKILYEFSVGSGYRKAGLVLFGSFGFLFLLFPPHVFGILFFLGAFFYFNFYLKIANAFCFTDKRVVIHQGWLSTKTTSVQYDKITDVTVISPLLYRIIANTGHLVINTAGTNLPEIVLKQIGSPYETRKKLNHVRDRYSLEK